MDVACGTLVGIPLMLNLLSGEIGTHVKNVYNRSHFLFTFLKLSYPSHVVTALDSEMTTFIADILGWLGGAGGCGWEIGQCSSRSPVLCAVSGKAEQRTDHS